MNYYKINSSFEIERKLLNNLQKIINGIKDNDIEISYLILKIL